jgi:hypothetical protein
VSARRVLATTTAPINMYKPRISALPYLVAAALLEPLSFAGA